MFVFGLSVLHHPVLQDGIRRSSYWRHERSLVNIVASNKRQFERRDYDVCDVKEGTRFVYSSCNVALHPGEYLTSYHAPKEVRVITFKVRTHFRFQQNPSGFSLVFCRLKVLGNM
jgi:hypothetical protein